MNRDSSVGIVTSIQVGRCGVRILAEGGFSLFKDAQMESGAHTDFYSMFTGVLFRM
jgi:hypothetical protein